MKSRAAALSALLIVSAVSAVSQAPLDLGGFDDVSRWRTAPSEGVTGVLSRAAGPHEAALRLDFDFGGKAGWAAARRDLPVEFPDDWEIDFLVRGQGGGNDLEVKLVDASGENVWWSVLREFEPPASWQPVRLKKRRFSFAWGPAGGGELRRAAAIELAVTARAGGRGSLEISELRLVRRARGPAEAAPPVARASSSLPGFGPERVLDGDPATVWKSTPSSPAWLALDFGAPREYGGLTVRWEPGRAPSRFFVETSDDGAAWTVVREVRENDGRRSDLFLPESESRLIRIRAPQPAPAGYGVAEVVVRPLSFGESVNAFFEAMAKEAPRGTWPRSFSGEQTYWTVAGVSGDSDSALFSEDGAAEPRAGAFSVEPFLYAGGRLSTWADGETRHELEGLDLPIPRVERRAGNLSLEITALASGRPGSAALHLRYRVSNAGGSAVRAKLFLAIRPLQVNPPSQFLNRPGGFTPIRSAAWDGRAVSIDGIPSVFPAVPPSGFGAVSFDGGRITDFLARGALPFASRVRVDDPSGRASAALAFELDLPPGGGDEVSIELPIHPGTPRDASAPAGRAEARRAFALLLADASRSWKDELGRVTFTGPPAAEELFRTARVNLANILIERDGAALRPGTRAYARSWIRDGAMMSAALLRLGHTPEAREYAEWFARYQSAEGRVPCCVDRRGADPVVENDSHGELLFLVAEVWRYTRDDSWLARLFPHVEGAVSWIDRERLRRRTKEHEAPEKRMFYGLMPESISHEGYSAKPVHSYWDDFWTLRGLKDAVAMAAVAGRPDLAGRWSAIRDEFARDLYASIELVRRSKGIDFIPGSAELGDFDATSTTIALDPAGELARLPAAALASTFDRYDAEFRARLAAREWDYTPYEIRNVGAFVRLGKRDEAMRLMDFFLASRRPSGWRGWAEAVASDPRKVKFVGDIPHAWVGSDFIRSLTDLFAWERESDGALVVASGVPAAWFDGYSGPVGVSGLRTPHGALTFSMRREGGVFRVRVEAGISVPPGGIVLRPPLPPGGCEARIGGAAAECRNGEVTIRRVPADVVMSAAGRP